MAIFATIKEISNQLNMIIGVVLERTDLENRQQDGPRRAERRMIKREIGRYTIKDTLGRGAMGLVYKGYDAKIDREVAIKTIRKAAFAENELKMALERFQHEAQAAGKLNHPNIVTVYDFGEHGNNAYIAMEFAEGKTLSEVIASGKAMSMAMISNILIQLLGGLDYAHANKVVHRDIKTGNIILARGGKVKIMDFGIARLESSSLTTIGSLLGTPAYMAPELFEGKEADGRSDLFAVGIIVYQLLCGCKPFSGQTMTAIMHQVMDIEPTPPREIIPALPAGINKLMAKALAKEPEQRFQTAAEFANAWKDMMQKVDPNMTPLSFLAETDKGQTSKRGLLVKFSLAILLLLFLGTGLFLGLLSTGKLNDLAIKVPAIAWLQKHPLFSGLGPNKNTGPKELKPLKTKKKKH